jgi:hypothetical protein
MANEKNLVQDAILQLKNLEEVVSENAKGILASTMKEEIKELVKESLNEAEEDEEIEDTEIEDDFDTEDEESDMEDMGDEDMEMDTEMDMDMEEPEMSDTIDLTSQPDGEFLKAFMLLGPEDNIVVTKDAAGNINVKDNETSKEYMIVTESEDEEYFEGDEEMLDEYFDDEDEDKDEDEFGFDFDEYQGEDEDEFEDEEEFEYKDEDDDYGIFDESDEEEFDEVVYEIKMGDEEEEMMEGDEEDMFGEEYEEEDLFGEEYDEEEMMEGDDEEMFGEEYDEEEEEEFFESLSEAKKKAAKGFKAVGKGMGSPNVKIYHEKPNQGKGFNVKMKQGPKAVGTGKAKFEYKEGKNLKGDFNVKPSKMKGNKMEGKKMETKEASRTLGSGSMFRKGGLPKPRAHSKFNANIKENVNSVELQILKDKNIELRKALDVFREKLNEVAVFNSNLAYATRLFTEHSTSKQEKINILKRFDSAETLKESKNLYRTIKEELNSTKNQMNESIERKIEKVQTTGSAVNLIESKTYENPQFMRMKDLMQKLK